MKKYLLIIGLITIFGIGSFWVFKKRVPLSSNEDAIRNFISLIDSGNTDKATLMIKTKDESEMQMWGVQFAAIDSFKILKIEKANLNEWTDSKHVYKVVLDVVMNPSSVSAPIPYYGWQNGENTRWITLEKIGSIWKITNITTGP